MCPRGGHRIDDIERVAAAEIVSEQRVKGERPRYMVVQKDSVRKLFSFFVIIIIITKQRFLVSLVF